MWDKLEIYHSRRNAPTRRVSASPAPQLQPTDYQLESVTELWLNQLPFISDEEKEELNATIVEKLKGGKPASRLRHRLQEDTVGLQKTVFVRSNDGVYRQTTDAYISPQQILLGIYLIAANYQTQEILLHLQSTMKDGAPHADPTRWARNTLGLEKTQMTPTAVKKRFRELVKQTHPDLTLQQTELNMAKLVQAKNTLLKSIKTQEKPIEEQ